MGIFSRRKKPNPTVDVGYLTATFNVDDEWWSFCYAGKQFLSYGPSLILPSQERLDYILKDFDALAPEMTRRLEAGFKESLKDNISAFTGTGESVTIVLPENKDQACQFMWSGGAMWGDYAIEFDIRDGAIAAETWSD